MYMVQVSLVTSDPLRVQNQDILLFSKFMDACFTRKKKIVFIVLYNRSFHRTL